MGQAQSRLENQGYTNVTALQKDANGVWRGTAQKDGRTQQVWVDYKGNVGAGTEHASQTR
jgi:putative membrane protein